MTPRHHRLDGLAAEDADDVTGAESLIQACDAGENLARDCHGLRYGFELAKTEVACVAATPAVRLAEIFHEVTMPA